MKLNFRTTKPQTFLDAWNNNKPVQVVFAGKCVRCQRNTYQLNEGKGNFDPDPRGQIPPQYASSSLVALEYDMTGKDVPACFDCANDSEKYKKILTIARKSWGVNKNLD